MFLRSGHLLPNIDQHMSDLRRTHEFILVQVERHERLPDLSTPSDRPRTWTGLENCH